MRIEITFNVITILLSVIFILPQNTLAQPGTLDLSFGSGGKVTTSFGVNDFGKSLAIQSDGKIVLAGYSTIGDFELVRYNTNGSIDTSFDYDGKVFTSIGNDDECQSIAIQSDGKILAAGFSANGTSYSFALVRYNSNGSLDTTFDSDGKVTTIIGSNDDRGYSMSIQSDGKILLAGYSFNGLHKDFALVRYNSNGSLDSTFDFDGKLTTSFGSFDAVGNSIALQSDGKILVVGNYVINAVVVLTRYNSNGSLDSTFDFDGKLTTAIGLCDNAGHSIIVQPDAKILIAGRTNNCLGPIFVLIRYKSNGGLDSTFGTNGFVKDATRLSMGNAITLQQDNKILLAGWKDTSLSGSAPAFALMRFNTNGTIDSTFGTNGRTISMIGIQCLSFCIAIQSNSKILVGGQSTNSSFNALFALARYNNDTNFCPPIYFSQSFTFCFGDNVSVGSNVYGNSGTYTDILTSIVNGCDSIVTTNLTVLPINTFTQSFSICYGQSISVGSNIYTISGTYVDTFSSILNGCDSMIITNLLVLPIDTFSQSLTICDGQSVNVGINTYSLSGTYLDTLTSMLSGCDSIVTTNLTVLPINTFSHTLTICYGQSVSVGSNTYTSSGTYIDTLSSLLSGCDSIVTTNLTVSPISTFSQTQTICDGQSVSVGSNTYTLSGIYTDTLSAVNTCDSIVITNVNVTPKPLNTISINGVVITSNQNAGSYQWIDCDNGNSPIPGETNQSFTASINGNYAVIVTLNGCVDTSACGQIINSGIIDQLLNNSINVTINPNPFTNSTNIQANEFLKNSTLNIYNLLGQLVKQKINLNEYTITFYRDNLSSGLYFIELMQENKILFRNKLVIKD